MAHKNMLDETKTILEMMGESEEKVSLLREDLSQSNALCQQIKDNLKEMRNKRNRNTTELEDNDHLKNNIKKFNQQLLSFAQLVYNDNRELYSDLNLLDAEMIKNKELLYRTTETIEEKSNEYKARCMTLTQQLALLEKEGTENIRKGELELAALAAENEELEAEIKMLIQEIEHEENYIKSELAGLGDEEKIRTTVDDLQKCINSQKNKIKEFLKLIEQSIQLREKLESERETSILEWDQQFRESETEINESSSATDNCLLNIEKVSRKIEILEEQMIAMEEESRKYKIELNGIQTNLKEIEEDYNKRINCNEKLLSENEEKYEQLCQLGEQIKGDMHIFKNKTEAQREYLEKLQEFLSEHKTANTNLSAEIERWEEKRKGLKTTHQQLKEDYDKRILEVEAELNQGQADILAREQTNKKLQEATESLISELNELRNKTEQMLAENERQNREMGESDSLINGLNFEVAQTKTNKQKNKKRSSDANVHSSRANTSAIKEKKMRVSHWDSDSSLEGEDRRFSELIKEKMKMKKLGKTHIHK